ncbi:PP2C family protein-serine/threonine phosphatase [Blastococcus brunescens]|uniref:PP2C family protein-serine/threonine phosphatase n=1 Tax=Blastococcus brunescens TaxID=1564165 RepID=A0ABZ1B101_9ACTN|nr:PP2C family protein-serine/threonine phosphatase [Blastococcus sp. BMG 8361]WRL64037.1 PP2C family protein-serine/threonine phosphatase [Blastococcus sp. BMG 8361]
MPGLPEGFTSTLRQRIPWWSHPRRRAVVLAALLVAQWALVAGASTPGLAVAMYGLVPIVLAGYWFELRGALLLATAATLVFLTDKLLVSHPDLAGSTLWLATLNRALVFFSVGVLVTLLLRRERALTLRVRIQEEELAELDALRAALTPADVPERPHLTIATSFTPAEGLVAGDFFLVVDGPDASTTVVVGDVVGHGLDAARCAAFVRAALATFARFTADPVQLLQLANTALSEHRSAESRFVTVVCLNIAPPPGRTVRWAAAGHEVPWELDSASPLPGGRVGAPLGIGTPLTIGAGTYALAEGTGLLAFTDGLVEGRSARRDPSRPVELFGEERAQQLVRDHRGAEPAALLDALVSAVTAFTGGAPADDLCLVAVRATPALATSG